ncbi:26s proteasome non-atpase regulatory subunit 13-like protein [Dermatophagoides farinae]|uniref:26s proteasome non-atpase regulatory subunit 13-like protein n=1 Tax=Dermatophagoides farinae TaxID=6954 RepID=A0A9D4NSV7_DERFA|nr:26s proteasome non-atpase regulatory subunit 13-like protein [Dermatophagoides farinae]
MSSSNSFNDRRQLNRYYNAKQIDSSSELIIEIQLGLMHLIRLIISIIHSSIRRIIRRFTRKLNELYMNSALNILVFKLKTYSLIKQSRQNGLMEWLQQQLPLAPFKPNNFNTDWRDGIRLCALCEQIISGCCPRYDLLNPNNYVNNLKLALCLIRNNLNIQTDLNVKEIYECKNDAKLIHLLFRMKMVHTKAMLKSNDIRTKQSKRWENQKISKAKYLESYDQFFNNCKIKGMGITLGVRSRRSRFSIYFASSYPLDQCSFIIEILGPIGSFCSEKIEINNCSRRLQNSLNVIGQYFCHDEMIQNLTMKAAMKIKFHRMNLKIPFFCELMDDHILITYIPLYAGEHQISVIWQGQHIFGSPYYAMIEETEYLQQESNEIGPKFIPGIQYPLCLLQTDQEYGLDEIGTVIRKKTLRKSMIIKGKKYDYYTYLERLQKSRQFECSITNVNDNSLKNVKISIKHNKQSMSISDSSRTSSFYSGESECCCSPEPIKHESLPEDPMGNENEIIKNEQSEIATAEKSNRIRSKFFQLRKLRSHKSSLNENSLNNEFNVMAKKLKGKLRFHKKT